MEVQTFKRLLCVFQDRFKDGSKPFASTVLLKGRLDTRTAPQASVSPRPPSWAMREVVRNAMAKVDGNGIAEPGVGGWGSPIAMVKKSSGAWRLCCDYRQVDKSVIIPRAAFSENRRYLGFFP